MEKSISRALVTTVALLLFLRSSRVLDRGCHAFVVPQRTQRCSGKTGFSSTATTKPSGLGFGLSNPSSPSSSAAAAAPESAPSFFRSTSKTLIRSLESSSLSGDTGEGPLFASTSSPEATFESDSDLGDSSAALLLPSSDDEGLSPFLSMDQTRTIPALAEITMFPPAPTSSFVLVAQQPVSPPPPQELKLWQGRLLVVTCAAICGTNYPLIKILDNVGAIPTAAATALRFALAAVAVWAFVLAQEQRDKNDETKNPSPRRGPATWLGAEVGVYYGIAYIAQAMGLHTVDASKSAFFTALAVIVVPLLDALFKGKTLNWRSGSSVLLAMGGVALLQLGPSLFASIAATPVWWSTGDWWCLAQAFFFGLGYWRLEATSLRYPDQSPRIIAGQLVAIFMAAMVYWFAVDLGGSLPSLAQLHAWLFTDSSVWQIVVWTGLITTALAHYLETVALRVVSASELTIIMTSISLWGSAFAYLTMGEVMTPVAMVGGLSILAGCLLTASNGSDAKSVAPSP